MQIANILLLVCLTYVKKLNPLVSGKKHINKNKTKDLSVLQKWFAHSYRPNTFLEKTKKLSKPKFNFYYQLSFVS